MARTADSQPTTTGTGVPALVPHGRFKGKPPLPLGRPVTVIGARTRAHLHLVSPSVSKSHGMVVNTGTGYYVRDLASRTHVYVNGEKVHEATLKDGDILGVGPFTFRFTDPRKPGPAPRPVPAGVLRFAGRNLPMPLTGRTTLFGRRPTCDVPMEDLDVSTTHAILFEMNGKRYVRDLGSRTGTHVNGTAVHQEPLAFGDVIRIGDTEMTYVAAADAAAAQLDELEDLAGTAPLAGDDPIDLIFEEPAAKRQQPARGPQSNPQPPAAPPQRPAARFTEPAAAPTTGNGQARPPVAPAAAATAAAAAPAIPLVPAADDVDLDFAAPAGTAIGGAPPHADSLAGHTPGLALHDDAEDVSAPLPLDSLAGVPMPLADAGTPTVPATPAATAGVGEPDYGLQFTDVVTHEPSAAAEATAEDLGFAEDEPVVDTAGLVSPVLDEAPAPVEPAGEQKKAPVWRRLFGRKADAADAGVPAEPEDLVPPAEPMPSADLPVVAEAPLEPQPLESEPLEVATFASDPGVSPEREPAIELDALPDLAAPAEAPFASGAEVAGTLDSPAWQTAPAEPPADAAGEDWSLHDPVELTTEFAAAPATAGPVADAPNLEAVDLHDVEVVDKTEPTLESALGLDRVLPDDADAEPDLLAGAAADGAPDVLTDSVFGREVESFHESGLGPIVEDEPAAAAAPVQPHDGETAVAESEFSLAFAPAGEGPTATSSATATPEIVEPVAEQAVVPDADLALADDAGSRAPVIDETPHDALDDMFAPHEAGHDVEADDVADASPSFAGAPGEIAADEFDLASPPAATAAADVAESAPIAGAPAESGEWTSEDATAGYESEFAELASDSPAMADAPVIELSPDEDAPIDTAPEAELTSPVSSTFADAPGEASWVEAEGEFEGEPVAEDGPVSLGVSAAGVLSQDEASHAIDQDVVAETPVDTGPWSQSLAPPLAAQPDAGTDEGSFLADSAAAPDLSPVEEPFEADAVFPGAIGEPADAPSELRPAMGYASASDETRDEQPALEAEFLDVAAEPWAEADSPVFGESADAREMAEADARHADDVTELEPDPLGSGAAPVEMPWTDVPSAETAPDAGQEGAPRGPEDLFFGLERDTASFLGGMPLQLAPLRGPFAEGPADPGGPVSPADEFDDGFEPDDPELLPDVSGDLPDDSGAPAVADVPAGLAPPEPGKPRRPAPPPPPPRRGDAPGRVGGGPPASPFDLNLEDVPTDEIEIPPFGADDDTSPPAITPAAAPPVKPGPGTVGPTSRHLTTAFDGLAMSPVRQTDVFSQTPVAGISIPPFGGGIAGAAPAFGSRAAAAPPPPPPGSRAAEGDDDVDDDAHDEPLDLGFDTDAVDATEGEEMDANVLPPLGHTVADAGPMLPGRDRRPGGAGGSRRPPAYPAAAAADPEGGRRSPKRKKRWRIGRWGLFGVMVVCMAGASLAIWFGWPASTAKITAAVRFDDKMASLPEAQRNAILAGQRKQLDSAEVRASAREILEKKEGLPPGFLAASAGSEDVAAAARAYTALVDGARLVEKRPVIQLVHQSLDKAGDEKRMLALLEALYAANKPMRDEAGGAKNRLDEAKRKLERAQADEAELRPTLEEARKLLGDRDVVGERRADVEALQRKERPLSDAVVKASARVRALRADLLAAEIATPLDPEADPEQMPALPQDDEEVVEMGRRADELAASLAAQKKQRATKAEAASKALQESLAKFEEDIARAKGSMAEDSELGRYITMAERVQSKLREVSLDIQQQQQSDVQRLTLYKQKLADKNKARIGQAFAADKGLRRLQQDLALKERQLNTAENQGLTDDAAALGKEVAALKRQIDERQALLMTADGVAPEVQEFEQIVDEMLASMAADRERNDRRMAELLKDLAAQAPAAGSLPVEQKAFALNLEKRQAELSKAREQYAAAMEAASAEADAEVRRTETELASIQAKIEERKKQVAATARASMTKEQQRQRQLATAKQKRQLEEAEKAEAAAEDAYQANADAMKAAKDELEQVTRLAERLDRENQKGVALMNDIDRLGDELTKLQQEKDASVVPVEPMEDHVTVADAAPDNRMVYLLGTNALLMALFFPVVIMAPKGGFGGPPEDGDEDDDGLPFASASDSDEPNADDNPGGNGDGHDPAQPGRPGGRADEPMTV